MSVLRPATRQITDWPTESLEMRRKERRDSTTLICWIFCLMVLSKIVIGKQRKKTLFSRVYPGFSCIACPAGEGASVRVRNIKRPPSEQWLDH